MKYQSALGVISGVRAKANENGVIWRWRRYGVMSLAG